MIRVDVLRAWPHRFECRALELADGACVGDALAHAGWSLDADFVGLAVFGQPATPLTHLHDGDRVELLRPLQMDPKQARRLRAGKSR